MSTVERIRWLDDAELALENIALGALDNARLSFVDGLYQQVHGNWHLIAPSGSITIDGDYTAEHLAVEQIYSPLLLAFSESVKSVISDLAIKAYLFGYYGSLWLMAMMLPENARSNIVVRQYRTDEIAGEVFSPWADDTLSGRLAKLSIDTRFALRREVFRSMAIGANADVLSKGLCDVVGVGIDVVHEARRAHRRPKARVTKSQLESRLRGLVAGESVHARSVGTDRAYTDNNGLVKGWVWRVSDVEPPPVCPNCMYYNGKEFYLGRDPVKPPLHNHCRCRQEVVTKSLSALGLGDVPGPFATVSYPDWALDTGVGYDGGLAALPMTKKGKISVPRPPKPKIVVGEVPGVLPRAGSPEWKLGPGTRYEGGLASFPLTKRGKISVPRQRKR